MGGRKLTNAIVAQMELEGEERIFAAYLESGTVRKMMNDLGLAHVSRQLFYEWLKAGGEERKARWQETREVRAEEAAELVWETGKTVTSETAAADRVKIDGAKWVAEQFNRKLYGKQGTTVQVAVGMGGEWLAALEVLEGEVEPEDE